VEQESGIVMGVAAMLTLRYFQPVFFPASVEEAWLGLALFGRSSAEPSWVDRSARFVGACWLAMLPRCT
jgi:hypothetical protein